MTLNSISPLEIIFHLSATLSVPGRPTQGRGPTPGHPAVWVSCGPGTAAERGLQWVCPRAALFTKGSAEAWATWPGPVTGSLWKSLESEPTILGRQPGLRVAHLQLAPC